MKKQTDTIRRLNDELRTGPVKVGHVFVTAGVLGLGGDTVKGVMKAVREYDDFTEHNDPNNEHDFGSFDYGEHAIVWRINYYDLSLKHGSDDPSDTTITKRMLTVMLAEEC